jgi:adenosylcobinamide-GDP ribazoletransferase
VARETVNPLHSLGTDHPSASHVRSLGARIRAELRACAAAFTFLTRIPAMRLVAHSSADLPRSITYFPIVGAVVGLSGALVFAAVLPLWPPILAIIASMGWTVWMTGAFHEDALADAFDGFGGGWDREQVLAIMKDSRVGSYALVGIVIVLAAKIAALDAVFDTQSVARLAWSGGTVAIGRALVAAHVLGRWSSVVLMATHAYVRGSDPDRRLSAGQAVVTVTRGQVVASTAMALLIAGAALGRNILVVAVVAGAVTWLAGRYFVRRIGGITGDALGAANQCVELAVYFTLAAHR